MTTGTMEEKKFVKKTLTCRSNLACLACISPLGPLRGVVRAESQARKNHGLPGGAVGEAVRQ